MTSEVLVMNTNGLSLAADSAVTLGSGKIFSSADKLFQVHLKNPAAAMIYNAASFGLIPWEALIKRFRDTHNKSYSKMEHLVDVFKSYLNTCSACKENSEYEKHWVYERSMRLLTSVIDPTLAEEQDQPQREEGIDLKVLEKLSGALVEVDKLDFLEDFGVDDLKAFNLMYGSGLSEIISDWAGSLSEKLASAITDDVIEKAIQLSGSLLCRQYIDDREFTGLVIAGYGDDEFLPIAMTFRIDGMVLGKVRLKSEQVLDISVARQHVVETFAQSDGSQSFLFGLDEDSFKSVAKAVERGLHSIYNEILENAKSNNDEATEILVNDLVLRKFEKSIEITSAAMNDTPPGTKLIPIIAALPKAELADMAESLVNMTRFKRKMSTDTDTVGGPIDVAVITKSDGFVWVRRKHYFKSELNQRIIQSYGK